MIEFNSTGKFEIQEKKILKEWINAIISDEGFETGEIVYVFCDDDYLYKLNVEFLGHDTLTDIISFDYKMGNQINGEIYISTERVSDNALRFEQLFEDELHRVMIHGILHFCGYGDKTEAEAREMRFKEDSALRKLVVLKTER